jgi:hypothetical protein
MSSNCDILHYFAFCSLYVMYSLFRSRKGKCADKKGGRILDICFSTVFSYTFNLLLSTFIEREQVSYPYKNTINNSSAYFSLQNFTRDLKFSRLR